MITISARRGAPRFSEVVDVPTPHTETYPAGDRILQAFAEVIGFHPSIMLTEVCVMPDHVHLIIYVKERLEKPLGSFIGQAKGRATALIRELMNDEGLNVFEADFNDRIVYSRGRLGTLIDYVRDNPRRYLLKKAHPELFTVKHDISIGGNRFEACGNIFLLRQAEYEPVVIHRSWSAEELGAKQGQWRRCVRNGGILVSPFISPAEKEVMKSAIGAGGNVIVISSQELAERYKPTGGYFDLCSRGKLLILHPVGMEEGRLTRESALGMNKVAEEVCDVLNFGE